MAVRKRTGKGMKGMSIKSGDKRPTKSSGKIGRGCGAAQRGGGKVMR